MSTREYKDYPDSVYVPFSQDCFKNESTAQDLRNSDFLEYQFKENFKNHCSQKNS